MQKFEGFKKNRTKKHFLNPMMQLRLLLTGLLTLLFSISLSGCCLYKMPTDRCFSTVPATNNPHITQQKMSLIPGRE